MSISLRKLSAVMALLLAMVFTFSACGSKVEPWDGKVLRVGIDNTYPPMEYKDESGKNVGFDIELANAIAEKLGVKVEFVPTGWAAIFTALSTDKFDCIISSLSITDDRKKTIEFTRPYISNSQVIVVKADNTTIGSEKDLKDKVVGVQLGTTSEESCKEFTKTTPFKDFKKYDGMTEVLSDLKIGRVEAVVTDLVVAKYFVAMDKSKSYKIVNTTLPSEPIGVGTNKEVNKELASKIDKVIEGMMADGSLKKISEKWFGEDMTSNIK